MSKPGMKRVWFWVDADLYEQFKNDVKFKHYRSVPAQLRYMVANHVAESEAERQQEIKNESR